MFSVAAQTIWTFNAGANAEPFGCRTCSVKEACVRGDSGARLRLAGWLDARADAEGSEVESRGAESAERAMQRVWRMGEEGA